MDLASVTLDDKYRLEKGRVYLNGLQALTRLLLMQRHRDAAAGLNTAGFVSGYQGSPLNHMGSTLRNVGPLLESNNIHFQQGHNEELAATAVWGSQQVTLMPGARYDGVFSLWYGKWAGVGRCGDTFLHGNSAGAARHGGVLIVCGDDHMGHSSTVATQSEGMLLSPLIPVLNPADLQDYLDLGLHGWAMSRYSGSWVGFKALEETVESSASVYVDPDRVKIILPTDFELPPDGLNIRLPDQPLQMERRIIEFRLPAIQAYTRANKLDRVTIDSRTPRLGIVTTGKSYLDTLKALDLLGLDAASCEEIGIRLYKVAVTWPLEPVGLRAFSENLEELLVVEEKQPLMETQIKNQLFDLPSGRRPIVLGKREAVTDPELRGYLLPATGELSPEQIARLIARRIARFHRDSHLEDTAATIAAKEEAQAKPSLSPQLRGYLSDAGRVPYFCSGCPHNTSTRVPEGSSAISGVGCHFMASYIFPDSKIFSHMGAEGAAWIGQAPFTDTKHMFANLGDGTYYHSGLLSIRAALSAKVNITFKILFNDATAATGGQALPDALSVPGIVAQLTAEGVAKIVVVSDEPEKYGKADFPAGIAARHRDELDATQKELREELGVTIIVYDQTCAAEKRRRRKRGTFPDPQRGAFINTRVCEGCGDCNVKSNCVSVLPVETEFGRKRVIDQSSCNKDFSCTRGFCPSYVTVEGGKPRKGKALAADTIAFDKLPAPTLPTLATPYGMVIAGVGGTGVITIGALLGMAAHIEGKGVGVLDMTGVSQKGGAVTTFVRIADRPEAVKSIRVAAGEADAVIGCDLLVTCETKVLSRALKGRTRAVVNTNRLPTVAFIRDPDLKTPWGNMEAGLHQTFGAGAANLVDATRLANALLGDAITSNIFMLGYAFQHGLVPLSLASLLRAIEINGVNVEQNKLAFQWGRVAAHDPAEADRQALGGAAQTANERIDISLDATIERRVAFLTGYQDAAYAARFTDLVRKTRAAEAALSQNTILTEAVVRAYFKLLAYKDEYEVARLYTDGEFERQVRENFEGSYHLRYQLAPPLLARFDAKLGEPRKMSFGPWLRPALKLLARLRSLRGTPFDVFGHTAERREERRLITAYEATMAELLGRLNPSNVALIAEIAALPEMVRGYGHIKHDSIVAFEKKRSELLARLDAVSAAIAA
ncbi:MAG TPA: indolepyruvate ferredoxin oxidoreductase family protein [Aliidongia sp.]|uniref:indolepyruvate ferredoxin oxidoreductase family protein n=1 Tax=Aliidongia sp. TaxID=1914230 RepID=UPI002DDCEB87|nr:indolepyruvate ferredoxin oxidoreductase family protein [Aliidongia sp.]HEV2675657.1 indolepyruvate ferredoxin oxidoreductase family protein [Aliidongia sp.]